MKPPVECPRCGSSSTRWIVSVEVRVCLDCDLDYWWSPDDQAIVTSEATS